MTRWRTSYADTDKDGLCDGVEVNILGTNPLCQDSDGDGILDGNEDSDSDGLSDADEINVHKTDPKAADTDQDSLDDGEELKLKTNPLAVDSD